MQHRVWIDGKQASEVSVSDRSFQYGDGCFTTILVKQGLPVFWQDHLQRLQKTLAALCIEQPDWQQVEAWVKHACLPDELSGIKIHISRGSGGRGYSPKVSSGPQVTISHFDYPAHYPRWQQEGLTLGIAKPRLGLNPMLSGLKHNNRLEQVLVKSDLELQGQADGLVLDIHDNVIETSCANVFWVKDQTLFTPDLAQSGVTGIMRNRVLDWAEQLSLNVEIGDYRLPLLDSADEVFVSNCLLGIAPVTQIADKQFAIGSVCRQLQHRYQSAISAAKS